MAVLVPWQSRQLPLAVPAVDSLHTNSILTSASVTSLPEEYLHVYYIIADHVTFSQSGVRIRSGDGALNHLMYT